MATEAQLEALSTAYDRYNRLDATDTGSLADAREIIRAQNRLIDACVECGMRPDGDEFSFAANTVTAWLCSGVAAEEMA